MYVNGEQKIYLEVGKIKKNVTKRVFYKINKKRKNEFKIYGKFN